MRSTDLFTDSQASDIVAENASRGADASTALSRAVERVCAVQGRRSDTRGWDRLFERYPDARKSGLDAEIFEGVRGGMTPTEAYQTARMRAMSAKAEEEKSALRSVGPLSPEGEAGVSDPFLSGLNQKH